MRTKQCLNISNIQDFKRRIKFLSKRYETACVLDSCGIAPALDIGKYEFIVGLGAKQRFVQNKEDISGFKSFLSEQKDWLFGTVAYDLKGSLFPILYSKEKQIMVPDLEFFVPEVVVYILKDKKDKAYIESFDPNFQIGNLRCDKESSIGLKPIFKSSFTKEEYIQTVEKIKEDIEEGQYYEMNLCQEFVASTTKIDPYHLSEVLLSKSPAPFSAFYKSNEIYLLCASPERYMHRGGDTLTSQPIKGTMQRSLDPHEDEKFKLSLLQSEKERAENVMIVDLVRNDLAQISKAGTITVPELFGIYSFEHVHQMISTIQGNIDSPTNLADVLAATFPMGSMTGAPKMEVMKYIDHLEPCGRGLYSGSVGYIEPNGDFDFNVVIRSLLYDGKKKILSYHVGGAITYDSLPEEEYKECLLKAKGIQGLFES